MVLSFVHLKFSRVSYCRKVIWIEEFEIINNFIKGKFAKPHYEQVN